MPAKTEQFAVVMIPPTGRARVLGPYPRQARASGEGLNQFGPIVFGSPTPWRVVRIEL